MALMLLPLILATSEVVITNDVLRYHNYDHGIIHFHGDTRDPACLEGVNNRSVAGGELIVWWNEIEPEDGRFDWSVIDRNLDAWGGVEKFLDIRISTAHNSPNRTPAWLFNDHNVRRVGRGIWSSFEEDAGPYVLLNGAALTREPGKVINREGSVHVSTQAGLPFMQTDENALAAGGVYCVQFDFLAHAQGEYWVEAVSSEGGETAAVRLPFSCAAEQRGTRTFEIELGECPDYIIQWVGPDGGAISIDNAMVMRIQNNPAWHVEDDLANGLREWVPQNGAVISEDPALVPEGQHGIVFTQEQDAPTPFLTNNPEVFAIRQGDGFTFDCQFHAIEDSTIRFRMVSDQDPGNPLHNLVKTLKKGDSDWLRGYLPAYVWMPGCRVEFVLEGPGAVALTGLRYTRWSDTVTCFPDYFSPVFQEKWERLITAFAERYGNHPAVGLVGVGGVGRWEEVMLDEDVHGLLDDQWLSCGFTPERYLGHIEWAMDLYKGLLPHKRLRLCLAYGLAHQNDVDWIYRRVASAAAERGVGLKQNGLTEKYDTWSDDTNGSNLMYRYRYTHRDLSLTHETGGQIYNNGSNAHGHPLSLLNRGMVNGMDFLFLYGPDIREPNINRYFPYAASQMGATLFTTFYSHLGEYPMTNFHSPEPVMYHSQWLGLRQHQVSPRADVTYTVLDGQKCAATAPPGGDTIAFDVDDRQQYAGMFGVTINVDYFDEGTGTFAVGCHNSYTDTWDVVGKVQKQDTRQWRFASFAKSDWCQSPRNGGKDVQVDLVVHDLDHGVTRVRNVELQFVPAREWDTADIGPRIPISTEYVPVEDTYSFVIDLEALDTRGVSAVTLPLWSPQEPGTSVTGRVTAVRPGPDGPVREVISLKQCYLPGDRELFVLPFVPQNDATSLEIELFDARGPVGLYLNEEGGPFYTISCYIRPDAPFGYVNLNVTDNSFADIMGWTRRIHVDAPFQGFRVGGTGQEVRAITVRRQLPSGEWSVLADQATVHDDYMVWIEPHTAALVEVTIHPVDPALLDEDCVVACHPIGLQRGGAWPSADVAFFPKLLLGWNLSQPGMDGWTIVSGLDRTHRGELRVTEPNPVIESPSGLGFQTTDGQGIYLRLNNQTAAGMARVWWRAPDEAFNAAKSFLVPIVSGDLVKNAMLIRPEEGWTGVIDQIRLQPVCGATNAGLVSLYDIGIAEIAM